METLVAGIQALPHELQKDIIYRAYNNLKTEFETINNTLELLDDRKNLLNTFSTVIFDRMRHLALLIQDTHTDIANEINWDLDTYMAMF